MDHLLDEYTDAEVEEQRNQRGWRTYEGKLFHATRVLSLRRYNHLKDHGARLRERGFLSATEAAQAYGVCPETIRNWGRAGCIPMYHADGRGIMLFPPPGEHPHYKYERQLQQTPYPCRRSAVCNHIVVKGLRKIKQEAQHGPLAPRESIQ